MSNYVPGGKKRCRSVFPVQRKKKNRWCLASKKRTGWPFQSVWKKKTRCIPQESLWLKACIVQSHKGRANQKTAADDLKPGCAIVQHTNVLQGPRPPRGSPCTHYGGGGGSGGGQGFFTPFLSFLPETLSPSNPSAAAHIQLRAIIPIDPLRSPNRMWVSEDFLFVPDSPMWQAGSREEVRSQLPGDSDWEWSGCDLFSMEKSQSRQMWAGGRIEECPHPHPTPQPHQGLLAWEGLGECWWCWRGKGEGGAEDTEEAAEWEEVRASLHPSSVLLGFLQQPLSSWASVDAFQLPYERRHPWRDALVLPSFLSFHSPRTVFAPSSSQRMPTLWH